jgi:hypothetical protein
VIRASVARFVLLGLLVGSPSRGEETVHTEVFADWPDSAKVFLNDRLPIGSTPAELLALVPTLQPTEWGWGADATAFGIAGRFEAQVSGDCVYSHYFHFSAPAAVGDSLSAAIETMYIARWGLPRIRDGQDAPYFIRIRSWCLDGFSAAVSCTLAGDSREISFGFQELCAGDPRLRLPRPPCAQVE